MYMRLFLSVMWYDNYEKISRETRKLTKYSYNLPVKFTYHWIIQEESDQWTGFQQLSWSIYFR